MNFLVLILAISCSRAPLKDNSTSPFYSSGIEQFFLPELPNWANFSVSGKCFRSLPIQYLDFRKLKLSYDLTYSQLVDLQILFNQKKSEKLSEAEEKFLKPVEEMALFSEMLEQVKSNLRPFKVYETHKYNLLWLEGYLEQKSVKDLSDYLDQEDFSQDPTIIYSSCKSRWELEKWLSDNNIEFESFSLIGADSLVAFNFEIKNIPGLKLDLKSYLGKEIELKTFYLDKKMSELEF